MVRWRGLGQSAVDCVQRKQVFIATGNIYDLPVAVQECINATGNDNETSCYPDTVWFESVISFDIPSGEVNWRRRLTAVLAWTGACTANPSSSNCPLCPGPDADFGMAPSMVLGGRSHVGDHGGALTPDGNDIVGVGQKNGNVYAYDAANGTLYWVTVVAPDTSNLGTMSYGLAVDEFRIYVSIINAFHETWALQPSGQNISNAAYGAVTLTDGTILWEVQVPRNWSNSASPTVANDVVIVGNTGLIDYMPRNNTLYGSVMFLGSTSGAALCEIGVDNQMWGGIAVDGRYFLFGTGYASGTGWEWNRLVQCVEGWFVNGETH
ncbi:hypothetical protein EJ03DRAFT_357422 [Teratosphaeria nubilosa]|uniref:Pyrrolo-quinoline quinone repeat domain-containing protein n=1 Tax=Teratosphaeria nubilosa TaxID=161662 RepID=A0A6G1KVX3_9PEZI|nr:hypothetical protein EJ03DRAFT_357422 [Teratosphaeria nubilosa]